MRRGQPLRPPHPGDPRPAPAEWRQDIPQRRARGRYRDHKGRECRRSCHEARGRLLHRFSKQLILARSRESPSEIELKLTLADKAPEAKPGRRADKRGPCKGPKRADKAPPWSPNLARALARAVELSCDRDYFQPDSPASGSRRSIPVPTAPYSRRLAPAGASRAHTASPSNRVAPDTRRGLEESRDELVP